ncbi:MAG: hypothetical protein AAF745_11415, partial [Planctomycetota bacterium]
MIDHDGVLRYASSAVAQRLHTELDAIIGRSCLDAAVRCDGRTESASANLIDQSIGQDLDTILASLLPPSMKSARGYATAQRSWPGDHFDTSAVKTVLAEVHWIWIPDQSPDETLATTNAWIWGFVGDFCSDSDVPLSVWNAADGIAASNRANESLWQRRVVSQSIGQWFLTGTSECVVRCRQQIDLAIQSRIDIGLIGDSSEMTKTLGRTILRQNADFGDAQVVELDGSLMDAELLNAYSAPLIQTLKESDASGTFAGSFLIERLDDMASDALAQLIEWLEHWPDRLRLVGLATKSFGELPLSMRLRLSTLTIDVPTLTERAEDIPMLATMRLEYHRMRIRSPHVPQAKRNETPWTDEALEALVHYPWPGNADELDAAVRHAAEQTETRVDRRHLPLAVRSFGTEAKTHNRDEREAANISLDDELRQRERLLINDAMTAAGGNKAEAA